ncbi:MAG: T9SS type A sorting domain-containing protein [Williamsia sp.]|nr:T9SS type A sorting domain-containing protein [Williamsia sp.]
MKKTLLFLSTILLIDFIQAQTPVGYYPLDGNANDASGNGRNGVVYGATLTTDRSNIANRAYQFVPNQYIDLGNVAALKPTAAISFGGWFYRDSWTTSGSAGMLSCTEGAGYELYITSTNVQGWIHRNGAYATINIPVASISNGWHQFICTYDGRYTRIYMDGIQQADFNDAGGTYAIDYIGNNLLIGAEAFTGTTPAAGEYFTGKADGIRIYNVALTPTQVGQLYNATLPVHLDAFSVTGNGGAALLKWTGQNETDFSRYEVERSNDGINFISLTQVSARAGTGGNDYSLSDAVTKGNTYYYRLKMVNKDGTFIYSSVVKYTVTDRQTISLYPNPVSDYFAVKGAGDILQIDVVNLEGSLVKRFVPAADNRYSLSALRAGLYTVRIVTKDKRETTVPLLLK